MRTSSGSTRPRSSINGQRRSRGQGAPGRAELLYFPIPPAPTSPPAAPQLVRLDRGAATPTTDEVLSDPGADRHSARSFAAYRAYVDPIVCRPQHRPRLRRDTYRRLRRETEEFLRLVRGPVVDPGAFSPPISPRQLLPYVDTVVQRFPDALTATLLRPQRRPPRRAVADRADLVLLAGGGPLVQTSTTSWPGSRTVAWSTARTRSPGSTSTRCGRWPTCSGVGWRTRCTGSPCAAARSSTSHEYGLRSRRADARPTSPSKPARFLESFHTLLHCCARFFKGGRRHHRHRRRLPGAQRAARDPPDPRRGRHNQFGDLPSTPGPRC